MIALANTQLGAHWTQCADCNGWFDPYDDLAVTVPDYFDEKVICINCAKLAGVRFCADCGAYDGLVKCSETAWYSGSFVTWRCEDCAEDAGWARCVTCTEWVHPDDQCTAPGGSTLCNDCFFNSYDHCFDCGETCYRDDMIVYNGEMYCDSCAPNTDNFSPRGFHNRSGCTTKMGSERCYGLELETDDCDDYHNLASGGAWGAKNDPTCYGKEFYSDILDGDEGLEAIAELTALADENDWSTSNNCGYHLHIDMRQENDDSLFAAAYAYRATQTIWHGFVNERRCDNTYCHTARWSCADVVNYDGSFRQFTHNATRDRYEWLNLRAYDTHATFEVRLHHASLNEREISNWVKAHTRFVDWATTLGLAAVREKLHGKTSDEQFEIIAREAWQDEELRDYYVGKACSARLVA